MGMYGTDKKEVGMSEANEGKVKPIVVCLCGSTRFADQHAIERWKLERSGKHICLMINYLPAWYAKEQGWRGHDHFGEATGNKDVLDELHFHKIDLADEILVINIGGYIGESTSREIVYAMQLGKPVRLLEPTLLPECKARLDAMLKPNTPTTTKEP